MYRITKLQWARLGLLLGATAIILFLLPHADKQSYNYELNQPWKYPLLTAEFDMPILRDSVTAKTLRDSIDRNFIPFVERDTKSQKDVMERFANTVPGVASAEDVKMLDGVLRQVYSRGVLDTKVYGQLRNMRPRRVRMMVRENGATTVSTLDASSMLSAARAFEFIDSVYKHTHGGKAIEGNLAKALNICLVPNMVTDSVADTKFRNQEYLQVNGAMGVIKKGQRIVDRGEIVDSQIYTNLNTYMELLDKSQSTRNDHRYFYAGQAIYILICFSILYLFMKLYRSRFYDSLRKMTFLMAFITLIVVFAIMMFEYVPNGMFFVPFAMVPVVILVFFDSRTAIFALLVTVLISALVAVFPYQFIFMEMFTGLVAAFSIRRLSERSQLLRTAAYSFLAYCISYLVMCVIMDGNLSSFAWRMIGIFAINAVILSFAYIMILVVEKIFGFTSTVTLVELSDINNKLLRRLAEEAPGTFQHSMQVSTLASEAARAIGADTQLVRTGALYHDIGKLDSPIFFTENQHGINPHTGLNPETSAQKIISHVTAGLQIAAKENIPELIRSFITEHHGKSMARYFYNTAVNQSADGVVDKSKFTYPGPNPQSKETAILMMADAVEAASRSLPDYTKESIDALVEKIINAQQNEGLFRESPISFRDVEIVKETFKKRLATIYHSRVAYPEIKK
ncbi:MAG: HDIG domain-containing protein [Muribaculaceae bacterium]|nr:HDIG domain-containing protein [Muribaculaceae bacterium]